MAAAAFAVMFYANAPGLGVSPDSAFYFAGANSLRAGAGYTFPDGIGDPEPITHFPPLYSAVLAALSMTGLTVMQGARLLHALLYAGSGVLLAVLLYNGTKRDPLIALGGMLLFLAIEDIVRIHTYLWTESLFYFLTLLGFLLLVLALRLDKWIYLFGAAIPPGLALLTRYAGLANAAAGAAVIFLLAEGWGAKLKRTAVYAAVSAGLPALVFLWLSSRPGVRSRRALIFHPLPEGALKASLDDIAVWMVPGRFLNTAVQWVILSAAGAVIAFLFLRGLKGWLFSKSESRDPRALISLLYSVSYFCLLVFTVLFIDDQAALVSRLLSPLIAPVIVFILVSSYEVLLYRGITFSHLLMLVLVPVIGFNIVHSSYRIQMSHGGGGKSFNASGWRSKEILHWLDNLPEGTPVYSNGNDAVYFLREEPCARLPYKYSPHTGLDNAHYEQDVEELQQVLEDGGVILYLSRFSWRDYLLQLEELHDIYYLETIFEDESGAVLQLKAYDSE